MIPDIRKNCLTADSGPQLSDSFSAAGSRILYCSTSIEILTQSADFSADQTEIQCQFRSASSMQPAGGLPVWVKPWRNGHFGAEMQPVAVAPAPN